MVIGKSNKIYNNIYISLTTAIAITIFILSSILYANFEQIALSLLYSSSKDNLTQISYSVDFMTKMAKSLAQQIYYDPKIAQLLYFPADSAQETDALQQLDNYRYSNTSFINSIYVYSRRSDDLYLSLPSNSSYVQNIDEFYDKGMADIIKSIGSYKRFEVIPRRVPVPIASRNTTKEVEAYTFLYYESVTGNKPDGAIILNISEEWIHDTINSLNNDPVQNSFIINNKGIMLSSSKTQEMLTDISQEAYVNRILASPDSSGYVVEKVDGVKSLVTYVTLESTGWKFLMVTPYKNVVGKINKMQYLTILIGFIILFAGVLFSFIMTKRIYKPIDRVIENLNSLKIEKQEINNTLKQKVLQNLLLGMRESETESARLKFSRLDISLKPDKEFLLLILKIDYYSDFCNSYNNTDRNLFKFAIGNISSEICSRHFCNEPIDIAGDHVVVLLNINSGITEECCSNLYQIAKDIQEMVKQHLQISLSVTISVVGKILAEISGIYNEALEYSNYRLFYGHGCVINVRDGLTVQSKEYIYPVGKEELLINKLMLGKTGEMKEIYREIIQSAGDCSFAAFNIALLRVYSTVYAAIINLSKSNGFTINYNSDIFLKELNRLETIQEVNEKFFTLFDYIAACLNERKNSKNDDLLNKINIIIQDKYSDPNLCLNMIADNLSMSPVYLGRLFKNLTTKSIGEYISHYRMEVARDLLEKTGCSINEIAEKIGILNKSHFYTIFKQEYGITPNEHRKTYGKQAFINGKSKDEG